MDNKLYSPVSKKLVEFPTLNEEEFYEAYLTLDNLTKPKNKRLSSKAIIFLSAYLAYPLNTEIPYGKRRSVNDRANKKIVVKLGNSVGITETYAYYLMNELRKKKALIVTEDKLIKPNKDLATLQAGTKRMLKSYPVMKFEYVFSAKVVLDDEYNESNLPTSSKGNEIQPPAS